MSMIAKAEHLVISSDEEFYSKIKDLSSKHTTVVYFHVDWAPQCKLIETAMIEAAKGDEYVHFKFVQVLIEKTAEIAKKEGIEDVPCVWIYQHNKVEDKITGSDVPNIIARLNYWKQPEHDIILEKQPQQEPSLDERLKTLINSSDVMLFMKGTPQEPRCGFSRKIVDLLTAQGLSFGHFNILMDEDVRQGLKLFSNWPTYPQLYVKGELIGGLDIVKELIESGEFKDMI